MSDARTSRMAPAILRLFQQGAVYALGNFALKAAGLLLLPLYLDPNRLTVADYGYLGLVETTAQLAIAIAGLGLATGLLRFTAGESSEADDGPYIGTAFATTLLAAVVAFLVIWVAAPLLATVVVGGADRAIIVRWTGAYVALKVLYAVPLMVLRVRERPDLYVAALIAEVGLLIIGVWYALTVLGAGLEGIVVAMAVSTLVVAVPLSAYVLFTTSPAVKPELGVRLLSFGAPLSVAAIAGILLNTGDRFVLEALVGPQILAAYVLASKFGGLINMLFAQSFNLAFSVLGLKAISTDGTTDVHRRAFRHYVVLAGWGVLAVSVMARELIMVMARDVTYLDADPLILPIAYGFLLYGLYYLVLNILYAADKTVRVATLVFGAAVGNILLNLALIPVIGAMGAALATALAYGLLLWSAVRHAGRSMPLRLPWRYLLVVTMVVVGLWLMAQPTELLLSTPRLLARLSLVLAYPVLVVTLGLYGPSEIRSMWVSLRERVGR